VHDASVFSNSALYERVTSDNFSQGHICYIEGINVALFLVDDSDYPLLKWLLKPFPFSGDLPTTNYRNLSRAQIVSSGISNSDYPNSSDDCSIQHLPKGVCFIRVFYHRCMFY